MTYVLRDINCAFVKVRILASWDLSKMDSHASRRFYPQLIYSSHYLLYQGFLVEQSSPGVHYCCSNL